MNNENVVVKQKDNKGIIVLLILVIVGLVGFMAYDKYSSTKVDNKEANNAEVSNNNVKEEDKKEIKLKDKSKDVVYDLVNQDFDGLDDNGYKVKLSYQLPYINIDSKYADVVNSEISNIKNDGQDIFYKSFINNNILSIVIQTSGDFTDKYVYNIDIYTGEKISNEDLLVSKNITKEQVIEKLNTYTDNMFNSIGSVSESVYAGTRQFNEMFLASLLYLNDNNELVVRLYYSPIAGALTAHSMWFNIDQNQEIIITK